MKAMADNTIGDSTTTALITVVLGIFSWMARNVDIGQLAGFISITVGFYNLYINWPKFKERIKQTFKINKK